MSGKKKINDDMVFQSFSKNYVFESNKDNNKTSQNEIFEFSFKKNLFLQKSDENYNFNNNLISSKIENASNIYSKNDRNIQESGHFGKSKYDSKDYKEIIEKNALKKQPIFYIKEKYNRMKEEKEEKNAKNTTGLKSNSSNSSLFSEKMKKIQIIRKKKSIKNNNSINYNGKKKLKDESFSLLRNNNANDETSYLYKKKITNNNINLSKISNFRDSSYDDGKINKTFYKINNTINVNEIQNYKKYNKYEIINLYGNNIQNTKILENNRTSINRPKLKAINTNYILKRLKENKENNSNNYNNIIVNNKNIHNIIINDNNFCPNLGNIKFINFEPERTYRNIYKVSKYSNKIIKNENMERIKNEFKIKNMKRINNLIHPTNSHCVLPRNKNIRYEKENKTKNLNSNISFANSKLNTINNKSIGLYKTRTHHSKMENKKVKNIPNKKVPDKIKFLKERIMNWYPDKMNF